MLRPLVSVLVASYNHERFIEQSINSVLNQTYENIEVIIVDDGSTDDSATLIHAFQDKKISAYILEKNVGMSEAFNYAISKAKGKYLARIDSDDFWELDKIEKQVRYMEIHESCGACFTWVNVVDENSIPLSTYECEQRDVTFNSQNRKASDWVHDLYFNGCQLCHPSAMIRAHILEEIGLYKISLRQIQDLDLWMRIAKKYELHIIQEKLINYRWIKSGGSNVSAYSPVVERRGRKEWFDVTATYLDDMSDDQFKETFIRHFRNKKAETKEELLCERVFIMLLPTSYSNDVRLEGLRRLGKLLDNPQTNEILKTNYNFSANDYYKITGEVELFTLFDHNLHLHVNQIPISKLLSIRLRKYPIYDTAKRLKKYLRRT